MAKKVTAPKAVVVKKSSKAPKLTDRIRGKQLPHIGVLTREDLDDVIKLGEWFRDNPADTTYNTLLFGRLQALLFVYESTRTRMGFTRAMTELGGQTAYLNAKETQMGRGESVADTARALNEFVDCIAARLWKQEDMDIMASHMDKPVFNACTPRDHATHVIGELMAIKQVKGKLTGLNLVYTGMARGILHSFLRVCPVMDINLVLAIPESYARTLDEGIVKEGKDRAKKAGTRLEVVTDLKKAVKGADFVQASTLMRSMLAGEMSPEEKAVEIPKWTVTDEVLACAKSDVLYSHSGPAHRNVCASDAVMDGPRCIIPTEARNAFYAKKALYALMVK